MSNKSNRMFSVILVTIFALTFSISANAQKAPPKPKSAESKIGTFVKNSGHKSSYFGDGVWAIESPAVRVLIGSTPEIVVVFTIVAETGKYKLNAESLSEMLKLADELDQIKVVIDSRGDLSVRIDSKTQKMDQATFDETLSRVIDGHEKASARIEQYRIK